MSIANERKCIFCHRDSTHSRSVEHIVPESLGNMTHVLPKGVVCDKCNNYFSKAVEKPFLETLWARTLRFEQLLANKKGRVPVIPGVMSGPLNVDVRRRRIDGLLQVELCKDSYEKVSSMQTGRLHLPSSNMGRPSGTVVSRFIAKIALEALASLVMKDNGSVEYIRQHQQLNDLRNHARRGHIEDWPVNIRQIYSADAQTLQVGRDPFQIIHEFDFLVTRNQEWFFVLVIFGLEFVINLGGPDIEGYRLWLIKNDHQSPLYWGKNAGFQFPD